MNLNIIKVMYDKSQANDIKDYYSMVKNWNIFF